jgi:hypothetical protein
MKPRRLHKLTIFSIRWASVGVLIIFATDEHRLTQIQTKAAGHRRTPTRKRRATLKLMAALQAPSVLIRVNPWLSLCFDFDLGLDRIRDEALLVRGVIHLLDFLRSRLFFAGEFESLP